MRSPTLASAFRRYSITSNLNRESRKEDPRRSTKQKIENEVVIVCVCARARKREKEKAKMRRKRQTKDREKRQRAKTEREREREREEYILSTHRGAVQGSPSIFLLNIHIDAFLDLVFDFTEKSI